jgi:hypothetical protein
MYTKNPHDPFTYESDGNYETPKIGSPTVTLLLAKIEFMRTLLVDPQPGLLVWRHAYQQARKELLDFLQD